jgi:hypothetical protein
VALIQGEQDRAIPMFEEGMAQARKRGDRLGTFGDSSEIFWNVTL